MIEQEELGDLLDQMQELQARQKFLKDRLREAEDLREELREIEGVWGGSGKLSWLEKRIEDAKLKCEDAKKPTVVFVSGDFWHRDKDYVVRKVTEKRIYIALRGSKNTAMYQIHGKAVSGGSQIDIEQTFGGPVPTPKEWKAKYDKA